MRTLSLDLRERILASYDHDQGTREQVARRYRVSLGMVKKLLQQRRRIGDIAPRHRFSGRKPLIVQSHQRAMRTLLEHKPDMTLPELRQATGLSCTLPAIHYVLKKMGLTYKKRRSAPANKIALMSHARAASGAKTNLTRLRGRAPRGRRVHAHCPCGNWHTTTMIGALRLDGSTSCMSIEGAADTLVFDAYIRQVLAPSLHPGDVVILDNLSPHKNEPTLQWLAQSGVEVRFLPPYSPDLNPIEKMWSKIKNRLRSAEARTPADLVEAIGQALRSVTPQDALNWFASCGYSFI